MRPQLQKSLMPQFHFITPSKVLTHFSKNVIKCITPSVRLSFSVALLKEETNIPLW